jgi:hypothetical protein
VRTSHLAEVIELSLEEFVHRRVEIEGEARGPSASEAFVEVKTSRAVGEQLQAAAGDLVESAGLRIEKVTATRHAFASPSGAGIRLSG